MPELLFVYGTLRPSVQHSAVNHLVCRFKPFCTGSANVELLDLGEYTGAIRTEDASRHVQGEIVEVPDDKQLWLELDEYEGYQRNSSGMSLFLRERIHVKQQDGTSIETWIYLYNQPIND